MSDAADAASTAAAGLKLKGRWCRCRRCRSSCVNLLEGTARPLTPPEPTQVAA